MALTVYNKLLHTIIKESTKYLDQISEAVDRISPGHQYRSLIESLGEIPLDESVSPLIRMCKVFDEIDRLTITLAGLSKFLEDTKYSMAALYNRSATYATNAFLHKQNALMAIVQWNDINPDDLVNSFTDNVTNEELIAATLVYMNYFVIALIARSELNNELREIVNKQKDIVIGSTERLGNNSGAVGAQLTMTRGRLTPTHIKKTMSELQHIAISGPSIILLYNGCMNPVEFNSSGLLDLNYVISADLLTSEFAGINKKILTKYATTIEGPASAPQRTEVLNGADQSYMVYENIMGDEFRQLCKGGKFIFTRSELEFVFSLSQRPVKYFEESYIDPIDPLYQMKADQYVRAKFEFSDDLLKRKMFDKFETAFKRVLSSIVTPEDFSIYVIDRGLISSVVTECIVNETSAYFDYKNPEVMCSHIGKFDALSRDFTANVESLVSKITIPARLFAEETRNVIEGSIMGYMSDAYRTAINNIRWTANFEPDIKESFMSYSAH